MADKIVIVESPAKAKTINKYLGNDYKVVASFGHIRDLPPKDGSVRPDEDFAMEWELGDRADRPVAEISKLARGAKEIYLASDPDREGEAIAWHVSEVLRERSLLKASTQLHRVTFNEITRKAVVDALANPRDIDQSLVDAYMARRALDYLVGFSLSPVLWRKLPGAKSAGRVQSVALRLICEREAEIERFKAREYWSIAGLFETTAGVKVPAFLTHLGGKKLDKFALTNEAEAKAAQTALTGLEYKVGAVEKKQTRRNPFPPFTTSTLQQGASRKLGLSATRTMRVAQNLYEGFDLGGETVGLITYMRTDGVSLSAEAIEGARKVIASDYGKNYLPDAPRVYKAAAKNAQEAHEAIRPTDMSRKPEDVAPYLDGESLKLYTLIWQRTMASQMESAVMDQVGVDIDATNGKGRFRANGSTVVFDGWLKVYQDDRDEDEKPDSAEGTRLPPLKTDDAMKAKEVKSEQHFTQPPPRYSEASLVKRLEELGIGRPSTYASIMQVLQDRSYVRLDKRRFVPEDRGRIVTTFLENFFHDYVEYDFTAELEEKLDKISDGSLPWKKVMREFWTDFSGAIAGTKDLKISDVIDALDAALSDHFFPPREDGTDPRGCVVCGKGRLGLRLGKYGAFLGCSNYPECQNTQPLVADGAAGSESSPRLPPRALGFDPQSGMAVSVRFGPYGPYVQMDLPEEKAESADTGKKKKTKKEPKAKPKRMSLLKGMDPNVIDLDTALALLSLPRTVGKHPESGDVILASVGKFGPYLKIGPRYKTLPETDDVLSIGLNRAVVLLAEPDTKGGNRAGSGSKALGEHPQDGKAITLNKGRFGPYVKWGKLMATVTKSYDPENLTLDDAVEILTAKLEKTGGAATTKKAAVKKAPAAKKAPVKKAPAKKTPAKSTKAKKT